MQLPDREAKGWKIEEKEESHEEGVQLAHGD